MSDASGDRRRILFATSNGTGLGHLSRAMAIARRLPERIESSFFTLSQAAPVVLDAGFRVEYHPAYRRPASGSDWQWNLRLRRRLEMLVADERPDLVVFDGVHPYRALTHVLSARGFEARSVWCRRPLWRAGSPAAALRRTGAFDAVLEPGELAAALDSGPTVARRGEAFRVGPIVYLDREELLSRERAAAELGLDPARPAALVNLGQGGPVDRAVARVLERLDAEPGMQVAALQSSIGSGLAVPAGVRRLEATFPMSRYLAAFDLAVAAAGYNAFHELIAFEVPTLFVPMPRQTDDQPARAAWAAEHGAGRAVADADDPDLPAELEALLEPRERERLAAGCRAADPAHGAAEAAAELARLADGGEPRPPVRERGRLGRWLHLSSHPVGPSLPLALTLTARDLLRHPERRRPLAVVYELGAGADRDERLRRAVESLGVPAGRVLVITDRRELAPLRSLGVAFERVPAPAELGVGRRDEGYRRLLARRIELILGRWRGGWPTSRVIELGGHAEEAVEAARAGGGE